MTYSDLLIPIRYYILFIINQDIALHLPLEPISLLAGTEVCNKHSLILFKGGIQRGRIHITFCRGSVFMELFKGYVYTILMTPAPCQMQSGLAVVSCSLFCLGH